MSIEDLNKNLIFGDDKVIIITGPTGVGKSHFAISLAKEIDGIIINADSMQVYNDIKIISSQPSNQDQEVIQHYLYGIKSSNEKFSVVEWIKCLEKLLISNKLLNKVPIIVGGTGLYIHGALNGISKIPVIKDDIVQESKLLFEKIGINNFLNLVKKIDPKHIEKNIDKHRLIRSYSIFKQTGLPLSDWHKNSKKYKIKKKFYSILLDQNRRFIYEKCDRRFDTFIDNGVVNEIKLLKEKNLSRSLPVFQCLGVKWILKYLEQEINFREAIKLSKRDTRRYVKRQLTWFRHNFKPDKIIMI